MGVARRAAKQNANEFEVGRHVQAASGALERADYYTAVPHLEAALRLSPRNPRLHVTLGVVFQMLRRSAEAVREFTIALQLSPDEAPALYGLGEAKALAGEHEEAEAFMRRAVALDPANIQAKLILSRTLRDLGRIEESEAESRAAIAAHSSEPSPYSAFAIQLQEEGRFEEARGLFAKSTELDPNHAPGYLGLVRGRTVTESDRDLLTRMTSALDQPRIRNSNRIDLLSGLGKAYDDLGEFGNAMACFSESNRLSYEEISASSTFSKEDFERYYDAPAKALSKEFIDAHRTPSESKPRPIFVVGMMRSGTTLVEQILSSHRSVAAGNEIMFWGPETYKCIDPASHSFDFHKALGSRKKYDRLLKRISPDAEFVTDKMPDNYRVLGAINMLYPDAKIIHCVRHPVDTCISILATPFRNPADYTRHPELLVYVYKKYRALMEYWRNTLPASSMLEVWYEEMIADRERVTQQMLEFCSLEWDGGCMYPEDNPRPVATASVWQARQPVYQTSVGRWRNYEPWLGPLAQLLEPASRNPEVRVL